MSDERLAGDGIHGFTVPEAREVVVAIEDVAELRRLKKVELRNPKFRGGREGVRNAIEERLGELVTTPGEKQRVTAHAPRRGADFVGQAGVLPPTAPRDHQGGE